MKASADHRPPTHFVAKGQELGVPAPNDLLGRPAFFPLRLEESGPGNFMGVVVRRSFPRERRNQRSVATQRRAVVEKEIVCDNLQGTSVRWANARDARVPEELVVHHSGPCLPEDLRPYALDGPWAALQQTSPRARRQVVAMAVQVRPARSAWATAWCERQAKPQPPAQDDLEALRATARGRHGWQRGQSTRCERTALGVQECSVAWAHGWLDMALRAGGVSCAARMVLPSTGPMPGSSTVPWPFGR